MANIFSLFGTIFIDSEKANKSIDDVTNKGKNSKKTLSELSDTCWELSKKMSIGFAGGVAAITGIVESTKEYRNTMNGLTTAFEVSGFASNTAKNTYKELYSVLGDTDKAKEASQFLALMTDNEKDLATWTDICTGVYATFGEALPIESLTEATNETIQVGQVTGTLADALNWVGISEDEFNLKLQECTSTQEREKLIRETLNTTYQEASNLYKQTNEGVMANNEAQANLTDTISNFAVIFEPYIAKAKDFLNNVLIACQPYVLFVLDNINIIGPLVVSVWATITSLGIINKIGSLKLAISGFFTLLSTNPIVLIIGAIIAALLLLITNWDKVKESIRSGVTFIVEKFNNLKEKVSNIFNNIKTAISNVMNGLISVVKVPINMWISYINFFIKALNKIKLPDFLGGFGINIPLIPKLRVGLDYVPYDDMPALLHKGERVLTADENKELIEKDKKQEQHITYNNTINIEKIEVREEQDINRIAEELYYLQKKEV